MITSPQVYYWNERDQENVYKENYHSGGWLNPSAK